MSNIPPPPPETGVLFHQHLVEKERAAAAARERDREPHGRAVPQAAVERRGRERAIREVRRLAQPRHGPSTSEFWVTILVAAAGLYLVVRGDVTNGTTLLAAAGVGYPLARGLAKK